MVSVLFPAVSQCLEQGLGHSKPLMCIFQVTEECYLQLCFDLIMTAVKTAGSCWLEIVLFHDTEEACGVV